MRPQLAGDAAGGECPQCGGTGWRMLAAAGGGHAVRCDCRIEAQAHGLWEQAGIPKRYEQCTLAGFECGAGGELEAALVLARGFAESYPAESRRTGLLFTGPVGTGKTHLAVAIARHLIEEKGVSCCFRDHRELLKAIQATFDPENPATEAGVVAPMLQAEVLVLDDLGVGRATEWALETLHYILNHRYSQERTTILTTNLDEEGRVKLVDAVGERLYSRLFEMCRLVRLRGEDYRKRLAQRRQLR